MLFNSLDFAVFLPIVFILYWFVVNRDLKLQNALVVLASYVFYGWWDWRFLLLIFFSTGVDYLVGLQLNKERKKKNRKILLWISVIVNLGFLGFFKYYNFFLDNFITAFSFFGMKINANTLNIILPVGISFYTFQTLSYTIDIYKKKLKPTKDFIAFSAFVSFFPQLVAGPIERASNLLPQFLKKRKFDYSKAVDGTRQILWGLFKKIVIADNCGQFANEIFANSADLNGSTLAIGVLFFTFQIYGDFSGYSDIAIGTARLFGFNLTQNFAYPFFSRTVPEFWRRWHISLTTWFRDYLFIPLLRWLPINNLTKVINVFILFVVIGFWHGARWNFILWGLLLAICFLPSLIIKNKKQTQVVAEGKFFPTLYELYKVLLTFSKFAIGSIFFRAESVEQILDFFIKIFSFSLLQKPELSNYTLASEVITLIAVFILIEWQGREHQYAIEKLGLKWNKSFRYISYYLMVCLILWYAGQEQEFIYFQF
jgi:D-alanyl-lipoteichoic acid acyltransferase DltB (MBOAT superfamily)